MKSILAVLLLSAAAAMAYPSASAPRPVLDKPDAAAIDGEWIVTTSYLFNQLREISETPLVPVAPKPPAEQPEGAPPLAEARSAVPGFQYDLNLDGKLDEFLALPLPPMLGAAYSPDRTDSSRIGSKVLVLTLPSFASASDDRAGRRLWLRAVSISQEVGVVDAAAAARGQSGLTGMAEWREVKSTAPAVAPAPKLTPIPPLPMAWLAFVLGAGLFWVQRRFRQRPLRIS